MSCRRATSATLVSVAKLSSTIRAFSAALHRRRRSGPDRIVAVVMTRVAPLIRKLMGTQTHARITPARRSSPDGYLFCESVEVLRALLRAVENSKRSLRWQRIGGPSLDQRSVRLDGDAYFAPSSLV